MAFRTAATSGVGFRYLPRKDAKTVGLFGSAGQAANQLLALKCQRPITRVKIYRRNPENRRKFAEKSEEQGDLFEPLEKKLIQREKINELGELAAKTFPGRTSDEQITYHKNNNGLGCADLAIAMRAYELAKQKRQAQQSIYLRPARSERKVGLSGNAAC